MTTSNLQKNKKIITISLLLLSLLILFCFSMDSASAADWTVGPGATYDYNSIQEAIDDTNTQPGDTITVDPNGTDSYQENVLVNKNNLSIQSNGAVTVSGSNPNSPVININSQGSLSRVTGFTLTGSSGSTGVKIDGASDVTISHLVIENCVCGVDITGNCNNIQIESVTIDSPTTNGIYVRGNVNNLVITGTTTNPTSITGTTTGIEKYYGSQINGLTIENTNIINPNVYGIYINDSTDWGGWTKNLLIQNVNVSGAGSTGIYINMATTQSENIEITQTTVTGGNNHGIYMSARGGNINIHNNPSSFSNNTGWGLYIYGYDNPTLTLTQNRIENNGNGLYLRGISNLTLPGDNTIINNGGINYQLVDCNNITLENTSFNNTVRNYNTAVNASNCNNLILQNLTISNNRLVAIFVGGTDVILRDITINNSTGTSIQLQGTSYNMLMEHLTINEPATVGIDIAGNVYTNNSEPALKITSNSNGPTTINQGHNHGISKGRDYQVNGLTIENTTINTTSGNGISIYDVSGYGGWTQNLIIKNVTITGSGSHGIYVRPLNPTSQNIEITQTSVTGRSGDGVHVEGRGNINI
ncbi:MAG: right-handed parallel beta-helix repeat-containing protein, partial [Methanobacterium sp.]|nr:right-handed parallel beta-helix repeat-containing protein [Methanobacterium sp.]